MKENIEVFQTDVHRIRDARLLTGELRACYPASAVSFDLEDCDRVLRIEGRGICPVKVAALLHAKGYLCTPLI